MGQDQSSQMQDIVSKAIYEEPISTLLSEEIHSLTYENFVSILGQLNQLAQECLDSNGDQLIFAVKKGTESTMFWKVTVQIACVKIHPHTKKISTYRLLNLVDFLKVFKNMKCQASAKEQSKVFDLAEMLQNSSGTSLNENSKECCICLDRKHEVILPCMHGFCIQCIDEWNSEHDTCPICREKLENPEDTWVISEVPKADEIAKEIQSNFMELAEEPSCSPS